MNPYLLSLGFLFLSLTLEVIASALALRCWLRRGPASRHTGLALSMGAMLLAVHHARSLELAAQTGLYDFFQATLGVGAGLALTLAAGQLRGAAHGA